MHFSTGGGGYSNPYSGLAKLSSSLVIVSGLYLGLSAFGLPFFDLSRYSNATDGNTESTSRVQVTIDSSCAMTAAVTPGKDHNATIVNGTYKTDIGETIIKSVCNDAGGYAVYAIGYSNDTEGDTDMYGSNGLKISTDVLRPGEDQSSFWSMKLTAVTGDYAPEIAYAEDYAIVPNTSTKVASFGGTTDNNTGSSFKTTYAAYISPSQPAGTYVGKVLYRLIHPNPKEDITSLTYMQDITQNAINKTEIGTTATLTDKRDGKTYTVAKLADGKVWMTQNLALGGKTAMTLTPEDTNITSNWTLPASVSKGDWSNSSSTPEFYAYTEDYDDSTTKYGNFYNWTAAIAMDNSSSVTSRDATTSICPKGWKLPTTNGYSYDDTNDFYNLMQHYTTTGYWDDWDDLWYDVTVSEFTNPPLSLAFSGVYSRGVNGQGNYSCWWSSSANTSNDAYFLGANSDGGVNPSSNVGRGIGNSVRCVAE